MSSAVYLYISISMSSAHSPTFPSLHLRHSSFSNPSVALPTSQLILQPFRRFTYVTTHSPTPSIASPTSQFILQPFFRFSCVTSSSLIHLASRPCSTNAPLHFVSNTEAENYNQGPEVNAFAYFFLCYNYNASKLQYMHESSVYKYSILNPIRYCI